MKQIIRVEHEDGLGLFVSTTDDGTNRPHCCLEIKSNYHQIRDRHEQFNSPQEDGLIIEYNDYCGYKSIIHIQAWIFKEEFPLLVKNNYRVYLLEVSAFKEGRDNILFKKEDIITKQDITNLFL